MKLYERELDEYEKEATRREQAELDEWAVLHRAVA
jgi:flagellar biosynthesis chaperone FliJ